MFKPLCRKYDFSYCKYVNVRNDTSFSFYTKYANVIDQRCNFFYRNLVDKKFCKPCYQTVLKNEFNVDSTEWKYIYRCKILDMSDKNLAEFNYIYKLLNNILCNNVYLSKWKKETHALCKICHVSETSKHLIFECENVVQIWNSLSLYLKIDIKWIHVIIGFVHEHNRKVISLNTLILYVAYRIYKYTCKMYYRLSSLDETNSSVLCHVKSSMYFIRLF